MSDVFGRDPDDQLSYQHARFAVVTCGEEGPENCRHEWNATHPDDQVTEEEQARFVEEVLEGIRDDHEHPERRQRRHEALKRQAQREMLEVAQDPADQEEIRAVQRDLHTHCDELGCER